MKTKMDPNGAHAESSVESTPSSKLEDIKVAVVKDEITPTLLDDTTGEEDSTRVEPLASVISEKSDVTVPINAPPSDAHQLADIVRHADILARFDAMKPKPDQDELSWLAGLEAMARKSQADATFGRVAIGKMVFEHPKKWGEIGAVKSNVATALGISSRQLQTYVQAWKAIDSLFAVPNLEVDFQIVFGRPIDDVPRAVGKMVLFQDPDADPEPVDPNAPMIPAPGAPDPDPDAPATDPKAPKEVNQDKLLKTVKLMVTGLMTKILALDLDIARNVRIEIDRELGATIRAIELGPIAKVNVPTLTENPDALRPRLRPVNANGYEFGALGRANITTSTGTLWKYTEWGYLATLNGREYAVSSTLSVLRVPRPPTDFKVRSNGRFPKICPTVPSIIVEVAALLGVDPADLVAETDRERGMPGDQVIQPVLGAKVRVLDAIWHVYTKSPGVILHNLVMGIVEAAKFSEGILPNLFNGVAEVAQAMINEENRITSNFVHGVVGAAQAMIDRDEQVLPNLCKGIAEAAQAMILRDEQVFPNLCRGIVAAAKAKKQEDREAAKAAKKAA